MSATTQIWVTLTASLGAALVSAALTQWWAGRRETVRWQRENDDRDVRWQRENDDRDVQWQRERKDRREEDRRQQYANLIAILDYWQSALESLRVTIYWAETTGPEVEPEDIEMKELWRHRDAARQAMAIVDLVAPPKVRSLGHSAVEAGETVNTDVRSEAVANDFRERRTALNDAMREDLGLPATAAVAKPEET
jgi:hypothetical protein